jgi:hypothetical protein
MRIYLKKAIYLLTFYICCFVLFTFLISSCIIKSEKHKLEPKIPFNRDFVIGYVHCYNRNEWLNYYQHRITSTEETSLELTEKLNQVALRVATELEYGDYAPESSDRDDEIDCDDYARLTVDYLRKENVNAIVVADFTHSWVAVNEGPVWYCYEPQIGEFMLESGSPSVWNAMWVNIENKAVYRYGDDWFDYAKNSLFILDW